MSKITIVIPNWNGEKLLAKNLPKVIEAKNNPKNNISQIIVVDDASEDNSLGLLKKNFSSEVKVVRHSENRGFASSVNRGVRNAKTKLVCLLNTDVVPTYNFLTNVSKLFKPNVFAVGLHERGYGPAAAKFDNGFFEHFNIGETEKNMESMWASGGSAVFDRKKWRELKGLDEELLSPFYWEDVDLGYRAWKRGYKILWEPSALVDHKHESVINSDNFKIKQLIRTKERNQLLFTWKNIHSRRLINKHIFHILKRGLRHPGYFRVVFLALRRWKLVLKKRKVEIKNEKVSDEAIFARFQK